MKYWLLSISLFSLLSVQASPIDLYVNKQLSREQVSAATLCNEATFLRRVYLLTTGKLPEAASAKAFLNSKDPNKRSALIDQLLASEAFVDRLVLKWGDLLRVKAEFPSNLWPNGVQAYQRWLKEQMMQQVPYNQFVRNLLLSSGSNFRQPAVNFYRAFQKRTPEGIADNVGLLFLGRRTGFAEAAVFFSQIQYKNTKEWKEEIVYIDPDIDLATGTVLMPDNTELTPDSHPDYRVALVDWLTSSANTRFAEVLANRIWYWLFSQGIVHEPDNFSSANPPSNPELLAYLAQELVSHQFNTKHLFRIILNSETFQRVSSPELEAPGSNFSFATYPLQRLTAEQLVDAIGSITGIRDSYSSKTPEPYSYFPPDMEARQLADGSVTSSQLELFGRPSRDLSYENDRNNEINSRQVLFLLNSSSLLDKIEQSPKLAQLVKDSTSEEDMLERIYLTVLNRLPSREERTIIAEVSASDKDKRQTANRLVWALLNSSEFLYIQ